MCNSVNATQQSSQGFHSLLQSQLLDADAAPQMDGDHTAISHAILRRISSGAPSSEDLYCEERSREVGCPQHTCSPATQDING